MCAWGQAMARAESSQWYQPSLCLGSWSVKYGDRDAKYSQRGLLDRTHTLSAEKVITVEPS